jgi:cyanophycinase
MRLPVITATLVLVGCAILGRPQLAAQVSSGPTTGWLVLSGSGEPVGNAELLRRFVDLAGGPSSQIIYIPTAATSIRTPSGFIANLPDTGEIVPSPTELETQLARLFGVERLRLLHTRSRAIANSEAFVAPLRTARAVWIGYGNAGRLMQLLGGTLLERELRALLNRGGVIGGNSAGAIVQGSFILRGRPDKPVLVAKGFTTGLGLLSNAAINPHLTAAKRQDELTQVLDTYPDLLGIGLDDDAGLVVHGDHAEVVGPGKVAIYDNQLHDGNWYYWLAPSDYFDLRTRRVAEPAQAPHDHSLTTPDASLQRTIAGHSPGCCP